MTLREHLEAIRDRHVMVAGISYVAPDYCGYCDTGKWPCADYSDAVAALAILNEADDFNRAVVNSPRDEHGEPTYIRYRLVPDPERPAATPTTTEAADA